MDVETKKLRNMVKTMRKLGILTYKSSEIEITLEAHAPKGAKAKLKASPVAPPQPTPKEREEAELRRLMWSAPGFTGKLPSAQDY